MSTSTRSSSCPSASPTNLEERKKRTYLSKMIEAKELDPNRVLMRVQKELNRSKGDAELLEDEE